MLKYIGKRMVHLIFIMIAVSFLTFLLMYLSPGDAAAKKLNAQGVAVSEEVLEKTREPANRTPADAALFAAVGLHNHCGKWRSGTKNACRSSHCFAMFTQS